MTLRSRLAAVAALLLALHLSFESPCYAENSSFIYAPEFGVTFPQPIRIGVEARTDTKVRYFFGGGYIKYPFSESTHQFSVMSFEGGARYFPHFYGLYAGLGLGYRRVGVTTNVSAFQIEGQAIATSASLALNTIYLFPSIGINFGLTKKLFIGFDIGVQYALAAWGSLNMNADGLTTNPNDLQVDNGPAMNRVAGLLVPEITLFRLSWVLD